MVPYWRNIDNSFSIFDFSVFGSNEVKKQVLNYDPVYQEEKASA